MEGTVKRAGRPLAGVQVIFWADVEAGTKGPRASGFTDAAGHYELRTDVGNRGTVIGKYRVCLLVPRLVMPLPPPATDPPKEKAAKPAVKLPSFYGKFKDTPLRAEVHSGSQTLNFDLP